MSNKPGLIEHIAKQTDTDPKDWRWVSTGTKKYELGYRLWNVVTGQHVKKVGG